MFPILDVIAAIGGLIIPPVFDFIKRKFTKTPSTAEETANTLAVTKPEVLAEYVKATADLLDAQTKFFNRDVVGEVSLWVRNIRAIIRPMTVAISLACLFADGLKFIQLVDGARITFEICVTSWMGSRFSIKD